MKKIYIIEYIILLNTEAADLTSFGIYSLINYKSDIRKYIGMLRHNNTFDHCKYKYTFGDTYAGTADACFCGNADISLQINLINFFKVIGASAVFGA